MYKHVILFTVVKKIIKSLPNVKTYSAVVYKNYYSFLSINISV